jgi:hypothetical protein
MENFLDSFLSREQKARPKIQKMYGTSSFISTSGLRRVLDDYGDDFDNMVPRAIGCVFGGLAASGAAIGTSGAALVGTGLIATAGYNVGYTVGKMVTGRVKGFIKETLDEAEAADNGSSYLN